MYCLLFEFNFFHGRSTTFTVELDFNQSNMRQEHLSIFTKDTGIKESDLIRKSLVLQEMSKSLTHSRRTWG